MKRLLPFLPLTALLLATMGVGPCDSQPLGSVDGGAATDSTVGGCVYAGKTYPVGASFPDTDGCNKCSCDARGQVGCTLLGCVDASVDSMSGCNYNGVTHKEGETFAATDGCNTCGCSSGSVSCTHKACPTTDGGAVDGGGTCLYQGITYAVKDTFPAIDGCNTCTCTSGGLAACTVNSCSSPDASTTVCTFGADQTCNEDLRVSSLRGTCLRDGTCKCTTRISPSTGKCLNPDNTTGEGCESGGVVLPIGAVTLCADNCSSCTCTAPGTLTPNGGSCKDLCTDIFFQSGPCAPESDWRKQADAGCAAIGKFLTNVSLNACKDPAVYASGNYKCCNTPPPCGNSNCKPGVEYCVRAAVNGAEKLATCRPYAAGCTTCACARLDAASTLQPIAGCASSTPVCTDGTSTLQAADTSQTLIVSCQIP
jgi:hypothetical protein